MKVTPEKELEILKRVQYGFCGGSIKSNIEDYKAMHAAGLIYLEFDDVLYFATSSTKGMRRLRERENLDGVQL